MFYLSISVLRKENTGKKRRWGANSQLGISEKGKTKVHTTSHDLARLFIIAQKKSSSSTRLFNLLMVENMNASHIFFLCKCQSFVLCGQRHTQLVFGV